MVKLLLLSLRKTLYMKGREPVIADDKKSLSTSGLTTVELIARNDNCLTSRQYYHSRVLGIEQVL